MQLKQERGKMGINFMLVILVVLCVVLTPLGEEANGLLNPRELEKFVDELPDMPRIRAYDVVDGLPVPTSLKIGMFFKKWKFHRDLPPTKVFAYGQSKYTATVPGPTIEALRGVDTHVTWQNHLPPKHILPWDPTIPTAIPRTRKGVPTVVHLHGAIAEPESDGHSDSWFTAGFKERGPTWTKAEYHYHNQQQPGNLYYHDHAMGLTRVNLLAGLFGSYIIRHHEVEAPLGLPSSDEFDRPLIIFDRAFLADGSIYMDPIGNNPSLHPQWQPEYFGNVTIVNGKAWPYKVVKRRRYRFRIINASNARFFNFYFSDDLEFIHIGSDSVYDEHPVMIKELLLAPSEIADVIIDFSKSKSDRIILANDAVYPYPGGDEVTEENKKVMLFIIEPHPELDTSRVPKNLIRYPSPDPSSASLTRYVSMFEYVNKTNDEPTHLYLNRKSYDEPATERPKVGTTEVWNVINLTEDNHPLHIHLGLFKVLGQTELVNLDEFKDCMKKHNDVKRCDISKHERGRIVKFHAHEKGWKNVYKMANGTVTKILIKFAFIHSNASYPFDATAEPGYVYHCHILDHEDNVMMRPLKLVK